MEVVGLDIKMDIICSSIGTVKQTEGLEDVQGWGEQDLENKPTWF